MKNRLRKIGKLLAASVVSVFMTGYADDGLRVHEEEISSSGVVSGSLSCDMSSPFGGRSDLARYVIKVPAGKKVAVKVTRDSGIMACDSLRFCVRAKDDTERHLGRQTDDVSYVFTVDNVLTLRLELSKSPVGIGFAMVNYQVSFDYSDSAYAAGSFTGERSAKFRSALLDSDGSLTGIRGAVAGILDLTTAKAKLATVSSKATGTLQLLGGRRYSVSGLVPISLNGPSQAKLQIKKFGLLEAAVTPETVVGKVDGVLDVVSAPVNCTKLANTTFDLSSFSVPLPKGEKLCSDLLPAGESVSIVGTKWSTAKSGGIRFDSQKLTVKALGANPSSLKLKYTEKTGLVSGSFKVYSTCYGRLVKRTAKINGAVVNGVAKCLITIDGIDWTGSAQIWVYP